jgi:hypothetical protein
MARIALRKPLGLLIALAALLVGLSVGTAYASDSAGTTVRADGTRVTAAARPAAALDSGNDGAWVTGVGYCSNINQNGDCWTWVNRTSGTPCPSGHFCIYHNVYASEGGKVFSFYHCRNGGSDWALQAWNGTGLYDNNNVGGKHAYIKRSNRTTLRDIAPDEYDRLDFRPAYYVQAC